MKELNESIDFEIAKFKKIVDNDGEGDKKSFDDCEIQLHFNGSCSGCRLNAKQQNYMIIGEDHCCNEFFNWDRTSSLDDAKTFLELLEKYKEEGPL